MNLSRRRPISLIFVATAAIAIAAPALADPGKADRILRSRGIQIQGMVTNGDVFHLSTFQDANYTTINWIFDSNVDLHGTAPGVPWARWVGDIAQMPPVGAESAYMSQLVELQLADEKDLNNPTVRQQAIDWFNAVRANFPNTILSTNSFGGQVNDAALADFIARAKPDLVSFDTYPWHSTYVPGPNGGTAGTPLPAVPTSWYGELRRYRVHTLNAGIPFGVYRQTFHAVEDYGDHNVYRDPSPSELRINTFGALAFGAKKITDFTYNTGASSIFTKPGGDSYPTALYPVLKQTNKEVQNFGWALMRLKPLIDHPDGGVATTDIMFLRGRYQDGTTQPFNAVPVGFIQDPDSVAYTDWVFQRNDPYMSGFAKVNVGTSANGVGAKNNALPGDVIFSWMKPADDSAGDVAHNGDGYMMVVNGFCGPDGTAADYRQRITLDFTIPAGGMPNTIQRLNRETGQVEDINYLGSAPYTPPANAPDGTAYYYFANTKRHLVFYLDGGSAELWKFKTTSPFVLTVPTTLMGDANADGLLDAADLAIMKNGLTNDLSGWINGDFDGDGHVTADDYALFNYSAAQQTANPGGSTPEPAAAVLLPMMAIAGRRRRNRTKAPSSK
jgi:hypothetical protein